MPLRPRTQRRAIPGGRDASRAFAVLHPYRPRYGEIAAIVHGHHDTAWLYSGTLNASGQARINHKRTQRAEFWRTVRIRVSAELEPYFRDSVGLLGHGCRITGRTPMEWGLVVDLDVHIPGAPADAVRAEPVWHSERVDAHSYQAVLDHIEWHRADGSTIPALAETGTAR